MRFTAWALLIGAIAAGCREDSTQSGNIQISWTGADTGTLTLPARAEWCAPDRVLEVIAASGDTGVGLAIFPADSLAPGLLPVRPPTDTTSRPRSGVALRWFGETLVTGFYSLSGSTTVATVKPIAGKFQTTLKSVVDGTQLNVTGTFSGLAAVSSCGARSRPDSVIR
ncbi:MAG: hypothetical protein ABI613_04385 [Gemmatimonadota bacterium]